MKRHRQLTALGILMAAGMQGQASAQADNPSLGAQQEAQAVLDRAIEAAGGAEALHAFRWARIELASQLATVGQGANPNTEPTLGQASRATAQIAGSQAVYHNYTGENLTFRYVVGDGDDWVHFAGPNTVAPVERLAAVGFLNRVTISPLVLLELLDRQDALRKIGTHEHHETYDVVAYADPMGRQVTLYFQQDGGHLVRAETVTNHAQLGDVAVSVLFDDYRDVDGVAVAHRMILRQGETITAQSDVTEIELGAQLADALLERPEDATDGAPVTAPAVTARTLEPEELADGIYFIPNAAQGYNAMYVEYDDGILVLETPISPAASRDVIRTIEERHPSKAVRWAVPTHYHFDHSGGLAGFVRNGTIIVTTEGNAEFVRQVGAATRTIGESGSDDDAMAQVKVETFSGRQSLGEGAKRVELIDVGPNPHVDEILAVYIPSIRALFVADLYGFNGTVAPANANQLAFAERLEELDLEIETFIPVHGQRSTAEQFWESVRLGREQQQ